MNKLITSIVIITLVVFTFAYKDAVGGAQNKKTDVKPEQGIPIKHILQQQLSRYEQRVKKQFSTTVNITVSCKDKTISKQLKSYLLRELREINDISITDDMLKSDWGINLTVIPIVINEANIGYAISTVITKPNYIHKEILQAYLNCETYVFGDADRAIKQNKEKWSEIYKYAIAYDTSTLRVCHNDKIKSECQELIALFDMEQIEHCRKIHKELKKINKKEFDRLKKVLNKKKTITND